MKVYSANEIVENVGRGLFLPQTAWIRYADLKNMLNETKQELEKFNFERLSSGQTFGIIGTACEIHMLNILLKKIENKI